MLVKVSRYFMCCFCLQIINLKYIAFYLQHCDENTLKVYDGASTSAPLLCTLCGTTLPPSVNSTTNFLFLVYKVNVLETTDGFRKIYAAFPRCK